MHKRRNDPGPDDMMQYDKAFIQVMDEHVELHKHFYTGHEHLADGTVVPGRTK